MRVLVSGAGGFIGRRLVPWLEREGHEVFALSRREATGLHPVVLEGTDRAALERSLSGIELDAVINLAAAGVRPDERGIDVLTRVNAILPCELLATARAQGARIFLQAGSSAEYGASTAQVRLTEDSAVIHDKPYGATKAIATRLLPLWGAEYDVRVTVLRLFNVFGPGEQPYRLFPSLVERLGRGETVPLSVGTQMRDFIHVDDVCLAMLMALHAMQGDDGLQGVFNVASGVAVSVADFAHTVARVLRVSDALLSFGALPLRPDDLPFVVGDPSRLMAASGWHPRYGIEDGIRTAVFEMQDMFAGLSCEKVLRS